jgi:hypothetical protein
MYADQIISTPQAGPIISTICTVFRYPLRVELQSVFTPVTWPEGFSPRGGMFSPWLSDLEDEEIVVPVAEKSCTKIEQFKSCWCGQYFGRTSLDYEA